MAIILGDRSCKKIQPPGYVKYRLEGAIVLTVKGPVGLQNSGPRLYT